MKHIKSILNKHLYQTGLIKSINTSLIIEEFENLSKELINKNINKKIKPLYLKNGILTVACFNTILIQEVNFYKAQIIENINKKFSQEVVKDIKFTL